jgi:hypothetical protein
MATIPILIAITHTPMVIMVLGRGVRVTGVMVDGAIMALGVRITGVMAEGVIMVLGAQAPGVIAEGVIMVLGVRVPGGMGRIADNTFFGQPRHIS